MIEPNTRTLRVGSTAYVWARLTEKTGADVSALTPDLRTVSPAGVISAWAAANPVEHPSLDVIRAGLLHVAAEVGWWDLEARLVDNPETEIVSLGGFRVVP
jgi:hypothetical protein